MCLLVVAAWSCRGSPSAPSPPPSGTWGGDHIALTIGDASSHLELDCAHADIGEAFSLTRAREFNLNGVFVREHGGPVREDEPLDAHPAAFTGLVVLDRMTLTIQLIDTDDTIGPFTLIRGAPGRVVKCL